jgi:Ca2+-binding EF-hand superfamily protein
MITSISHRSQPSSADFFSRIDADADGQLTADELKTDFESRIRKAADSTTGTSANTPPTPDFAQMVTDGDTDGDGTLSEVEFTTAMQARHATGSMPPPPPPPEQEADSASESDTASQSIADAVASLDTNGDGKLSADELLAAYKAKQTATTADTDTDASSDGSASTTATDPDFASLISTIDTDGDGLLNTDEVTSLVTESRQHRPPPPPPDFARLYAENSDEGSTASTTTSIGEA